MKLLAIFLLALSSLTLRAGQVAIEDEEPFFRSLTRSIAAITNSCGDFSLVISDGNYTGGGVNGVTNNPHDFTGSKVIVATVTSPNGDASSLSFASVPANTWVAGTAYTGAAGHVNQPYYCLQPTTSNGMYFYALSGNQTSVGFTVQGFSSSGTVFLDSQTGSTGSGSSIQPGSLTVHGTNLYVAALTFSGGSSFNGPSGFSSPQDSSGGGQPLQCYALTNTTQNPTWTMTAGTGLASSMLMFGSTGCSGGGNTFTLVDHQTGSASGVGVATVTLNTTGAKLVVVAVCNYDAAGGGTDTDPAHPGDTFTGLNIKGAPTGGHYTNQLFYCISPAQSASYAITCKHDYTILCAASFSYSGTTPSFDTQSTGAGSASFTTIQPGSATPTSTGLFITSLTWSAGGTGAAADSSFTLLDRVQEGSDALYGGMYYKTSSSSENPTWTAPTSGNAGGTTMGVFK